MKIEQIIEGRAEDIDKAIAALRAEKAALGGDAGQDDPRGKDDGPSLLDTKVALDRTQRARRGLGADGPAGKYATPKPSILPAAGTGADGPAGRYAPRRVAAGTGADGPAGRYAPRRPVAAGTGADGPAGRYAPRRVAAGTGADGPAGRYAPRRVAAGTGADGPAGQYATPDPRQTQPLFDPRNKNLGLEPGGITNQPIGGRGLEAGGMNAGISGYPGGRNWQGDDEANFITRMKNNAGLGGGTPKKGDDNAEWYNSPGTKMTPDAAKYADETGESPEIQKRDRGNLLKWMKANATKRKEFDQDAANK